MGILGTVFGPGHRWHYGAQALLRGAQAVSRADASDLEVIRDVWHLRGRVTKWEHRGPVGTLVLALGHVGCKWDSFDHWDTDSVSMAWRAMTWSALAHVLRRLWWYCQWQQLAADKRYEFAALAGRSADRVATTALWRVSAWPRRCMGI